MEIKDMGYLCPLCNETFEIPREVIIQMYQAIMNTTPIPKEELELAKQLKDIKVVFDVGARTDIDYLDLWPDAEFHLFEPNPAFFVDLQDKVKDKSNVFANMFGLGDKNETRVYYHPLQSFVGNGNAPQEVLGDSLPIQTLGKYVTDKDIKSIDFLKIDTEGHDLYVLIGAYNWRNTIKFIQYEHWGEHNNKMIKGLLADEFDCYEVGYRNVFCMNRNLVSEEERNRLKAYIINNKLGELV